MASLSEKLQWVLTADASGAVSAFQKTGKSAETELGKAEAKIDKLGGRLTKFGAGALAAAGIASAGLYQLGSSADDQQASLSALNQVLGDSAGKVTDWAKNSVEAAGLSKTAAYDATTAFGAIAKSAGLSKDAVSAFAIEQTQLSADMAAFKNVDPAEAIRDLQAGYAGSTEVLRKYNIYVDDATLKAAYFRETGEKVTGTLTSQQRIIAIHSEVLRQSADMQGQWNREIGSAAAQQAMAKASLEDLKASIGQGVLPVMTTLLSTGNKVFTMFNNAPEGVKTATGSVLAFGTIGLGALGGLSLVTGQIIKFRENIAKMGPVAKGAAVGVGLLAAGMYAMGQNAQSDAKALAAVGTAAGELSRAADPEVMAVFSAALLEGHLAGKSLESTMRTLVQANIEGAQRTLDMIDAQVKAGTASDDLRSKGDALRKAIDDEKAARKQVVETTKEQTEATDDSAASTTDMADRLVYAKARIEGAKQAQEDLTKANEEAKRKSDALADSIKSHTEKLKDLYSTERSAVDAKFAFRDATDEAKTKVEEMDTVLADSKATVDDQTSAIKSAKDAALEASEKYATMNGAAIDSEGGIRRQIDSLVAQRDALAPGSPLRKYLQEYIDALNNIPSNISTIMDLHISQGQVVTNQGDVIGARSGARASGGPVSAGGLYQVGEGGNPELYEQNGKQYLIPGDNGKVTAAMLGGGGGGGVNINLTVHAGIATDGYRVGQQIVNALNEMRRRNPGALRALAGN